MRGQFACDYMIGDRVIVDGDESIIGTVTGVLFFETGIEIRVGWVVNGDPKSFQIEEYRVSISKTIQEIDYPKLGAKPHGQAERRG